MSIRTERVAQLIQREVASILQRDFAGQLQPMVTVTDARVTPDLSIAYLHVSVLGNTAQERQATFRHLKELAPQIRQALASSIRHQMRTIPEVEFFLDETYQRAQRMETLLDRIHEERARREDDDADGESDPSLTESGSSASPSSTSTNGDA